MIVNYIILLTLTFLIILYKSILIIFGSPGIFEATTEVVAFWVGAAIFCHFFYCVYIFFKVRELKGNDGPKGIAGLQGDPGKDGKCNASCGQKVCVALVGKNINNYLKHKGFSALENQLMKNKINKMCYADTYYGVLLSDNKNRPNEKRLIEYIEKTIITWLDEILKHKKGRTFLGSSRATEKFFDKYSQPNPFDEIHKYDLWTWGEPYKIKPIVRIQCARKKKMPGGNDPKIYILETNNYLPPVFTTDTKLDVYGPPDCPYNQLGTGRNNEREIQKCFYYDGNNSIISDKPVYRETQYYNFRQQFSFYNTESITTTNNQLFFPCGTIWRGTNHIYRNRHDKIHGPEKRTIVISGEMKAPTDYTLIWSSAANCDDCMPSGNEVSFWRPVPPANYVSLGDVAVQGSQKPSVDMIKCVPEKYVREVDYEDMAWNERGFKVRTYDDQGTKLNENKMNKVSIWPIGYNNIDEEQLNLRKKKPLTLTGGYNLFRANNSHTKPSAKAYIIVGRYAANMTPEPVIGKNSKLGFGWLGGKPRNGKYSVYDYLGITTSAIITNADTENSPDGMGKTYYVENVKDNYYAIKCHDEATNSFNAFFTTGGNGLIKMKTLSPNNPNQLWFIDVIRDENNKIKRMDDLILVNMKNKASGNCFSQTYDNYGVITETEVECNSGSIFKFQSFTGDIFSD
jgi:hypothetical protein